MAGSGPVIRLRFDPAILAELGNVKEAYKSAAKQVRDLEKEMRVTEKLGGKVDAETFQRVQALKKAQEQYKVLVKAETANRTEWREMNKEVRRANSAVQGFRSIFIGKALKDLATGQGGLGDAAMLLAQSDRFVANLVRFVSPAFAKRVMPYVRGALTIAPFVAEAASFVQEHWDETKAKIALEKHIIAQELSGQISPAERALVDRTNAFNGIIDTATHVFSSKTAAKTSEILLTARHAAENVEKLTDNELETARISAVGAFAEHVSSLGEAVKSAIAESNPIAKFGFDMDVSGQKNFKLEQLTQFLPDEIRASEEEILLKHEEMTRRNRADFSKSELAKIAHEAYIKVTSARLSDDAREALDLAINNAEADKREEAEKQETAFTIQKKYEDERMKKFLVNSRDKRNSAMATLGQIFYIGD